MSRPSPRLTFLVGAALLYALVLVVTDGLRFAPLRDEGHFWPTALRFSERFLPTLDDLRSYPELSTPLPFVLFGWVEHLFHGGIRAGRLVNLTLSFVIVCMVGMPRGATVRGPILAAVGLLAFPYYLGTSVHLYTDIIAAFFVLLGVVAYRAERVWLSATAFVLAIASRQYMLAFPLAIAVYEFVQQRPPRLSARWIAPLVAALSLLGWVALFGGFAPAPALEWQAPSTAEPLRVFPHHGLYFLSCIGLYFVLPEVLLFRHASITAPQPWRPRRVASIALVLAGLFLLYPPLGNVEFWIPTMGYLDRAARAALGDPLRMLLFFLLALGACLRFARWSLASVLVAVNAVLMLKAHVGWDKYALPLLVVLWYLRATDETRLPAATTTRHALS